MKLRELFEQSGKTAVVAFGRMNPPTLGHEKLVDAVKSQQGDHFVFLSHTQKPKDNPLPYNIKSQFVKAAFPDVAVGDENVRTIIQVMQKLEEKGYKNVVYVAGSDRVESFKELLNKYNGKDYTFDSIDVVSAGERDPDADGAEGMSASKMRAAAASGDKEAFAQGLPKRLQQDWENVYSAVRTGMGIKEPETESVQEARKIDTSNYKSVKKSDKVELYINKKDPSNAIAILDDGVWDGTMMDDNDGWEFEKRRTSGLHGYFHVGNLKDLFDENFSESVTESQQLNEAFPLLIPALATAIRIGAPAVAKLATSQGAKTAAKSVAKNTGKAAAITGKAVVRNPGKSLAAVGAYEVWDSVTDAMEWLEEQDIAKELVKPLAQVIVKYGLPAGAVIAALYGGKKLYDYVKDNNDPEEEDILTALEKEVESTTQEGA